MTALTPAWTKLRFHPKQDKLYRTRARFCAVVAGRGSGKTELARRRVIRMLPVHKPWHDPLYFYALPTRDQAKRVAWEPLKALVPKTWLHPRSINESELSITTVFGSKLVLLGMDKPHRAEGVQYDGGVIDESSDQRPGVFSRTLMPAFSHRDAWCWRIGVPKRAGIGAAEFKDFWDRGNSGTDPEIESYTWPSADIVPADQIKKAREILDEKDYNEQYCASWETVGGLVFYAFSDILNVSDQVQYNAQLPLLIGSDFNVDPMSWVVCQVVGGMLLVLDELFIRNTNTQDTLNELHKRYGNHKAGFKFFGDATGRARKTSASVSDYMQIKNDARFEGSLTLYPNSNPARHDRFASCNAMFLNAGGVRRCFVHPRCKNLIKDLNTRAYKQGENEPDDYGDIGHITDALGYLIHWLFPLSVPLLTKIPEVHAA